MATAVGIGNELPFRRAVKIVVAGFSSRVSTTVFSFGPTPVVGYPLCCAFPSPPPSHFSTQSAHRIACVQAQSSVPAKIRYDGATHLLRLDRRLVVGHFGKCQRCSLHLEGTGVQNVPRSAWVNTDAASRRVSIYVAFAVFAGSIFFTHALRGTFCTLYPPGA